MSSRKVRELLRQCLFHGHSTCLWLFFFQIIGMIVVVLVEGILGPRGILWKKGMVFLCLCEILHTAADFGTDWFDCFKFLLCVLWSRYISNFFFPQKQKCVYISVVSCYRHCLLLICIFKYFPVYYKLLVCLNRYISVVACPPKVEAFHS